jgi:hypothetical protein
VNRTGKIRGAGVREGPDPRFRRWIEDGRRPAVDRGAPLAIYVEQNVLIHANPDLPTSTRSLGPSHDEYFYRTSLYVDYFVNNMKSHRSTWLH